MIMIAVVALLVLGGGGAGAYFYFFTPAEASAPKDGEHKKEAKADEDGEGHGAGVEFVELDPLILPIVDNDGVSQVVSLVVALEVSDAAAAERVKAMSPRLKDAYIQDMYGILNKHAAMKGGVLQVVDIKERLNKATTKIMGKDVVHDVLLQVVQQRPI